MELGEHPVEWLGRGALDDPPELPLREPSRMALPDQDLDELLGALDDRVVIVLGHGAAHVQGHARELAARPRGRLERLGALAPLAPSAAAHDYFSRSLARIHLTEAQRSLEVERAHRAAQQRRRLARVCPPRAFGIRPSIM